MNQTLQNRLTEIENAFESRKAQVITLFEPYPVLEEVVEESKILSVKYYFSNLKSTISHNNALRMFCIEKCLMARITNLYDVKVNKTYKIVTKLDCGSKSVWVTLTLEPINNKLLK
mgnify:CR=1 FL=1